MTVMSSSKQYQIVSGAQLPNFIGKNVALFGLVTKAVSPGNASFMFNTTDNLALTVHLKKPLSDEISNGTYIEVRGTYENTSQGKIIKAEEYFTFNNKSFDARSHTVLCKLINSIPNVYSIKK